MRGKSALWVSKKYCDAEAVILKTLSFDVGFATPSFFANLELIAKGGNTTSLEISRRLCLLYLRDFRFQTLPSSRVGRDIANIATECGEIAKLTAIGDIYLRTELETRLTKKG